VKYNTFSEHWSHANTKNYVCEEGTFAQWSGPLSGVEQARKTFHMQGYIVVQKHARENLTTTTVAKPINNWTGVPFERGNALFLAKIVRKKTSKEAVELIEDVKHIYKGYRMHKISYKDVGEFKMFLLWLKI